MADKRITDVDFVESLNSNESFFINQNNAIKQVKRNDITFYVPNGGTGKQSVTIGNFLVGNGTEPMQEKTPAEVLKLIGGISANPLSIYLSALNWSNMTQTVNVSEATENGVMFISPAPESHVDYNDAGVYCSAQADGILTFACSETPMVDLAVNVLILN